MGTSQLPPPGVALVIDGDADVRRACASLLAAAGLAVATVDDGAAGLAAIAGGGVDVVVASIRLADVTGPELLQAIRARDQVLPVVFVTSWPDFADHDDASALGGTVASAAFGYRVGRLVKSPVRGERAVTPSVG